MDFEYLYDEAFKEIEALKIPVKQTNSTHVFHQYTLIVKNGNRDGFAEHLKAKNIPFGIYYPIPLYNQIAFQQFVNDGFELTSTKYLCQSVISLPIHTEMNADIQNYIIQEVKSFFE